MMHQSIKIAACRHGSSAIEFALILPVLAGIMFAAMDLAGMWTMRLSLEQAAQRGIERATNRSGVSENIEYIRTEAVTAYGQPITASTVDMWLECEGVRQASITASCDTGQRALYVSLRLEDEYVPSLGWGGLVDSATINGGFAVVGDAAVRLQ